MISFPVFVRRSAAFSALGTGLFLAGCQTPDLKPFGTASADLVTSINSGGDLAIRPLLQTTVVLNGRTIAPTSAEHPAHALQESWRQRRRTADALLAYSGALAAIGDASANRRANAKALVDSVNGLAAAATGHNLISDAAGNLSGKILETFVEVKAFRDLAATVQSADPAIRAIAGVLKRDFADLASLYESQQSDAIIAATFAKAKVEDFSAKMLHARDRQRDAVALNPGDPAKSAELARLDAVLAGAEPELSAQRQKLKQEETALVTGLEFFAAADRAVDAWAAAHHDIGAALAAKRRPNLMLLATRAQELHDAIEAMKSAKHP